MRNKLDKVKIDIYIFTAIFLTERLHRFVIGVLLVRAKNIICFFKATNLFVIPIILFRRRHCSEISF
jgi:hypothetical protein